MAEDFSDGIPQQAGKEWRITTPESVDMLKLIDGEMALRSMARVLGWDFKEIEKPNETELTSAEILETSKETFGAETYGQFALDFLGWVGSGSKASVVSIGDNHHVRFAHSVFHSRFPAFQERLPVDRFVSETDLKRTVQEGFGAMQFPFMHEVHFHPRFKYGYNDPTYGRGYHVASVVPGIMTRERVSAFLQKPIREGGAAPADHELHGVLGRAFDVLCLASGVKETVDPDDTEAQGEIVPLSEFYALAEREGVSKGKLQTLKSKIQNAFLHQLLYCQTEAWGEVVAEGKPDLYYSSDGDGFRTVFLDTMAPSTFSAVRDSYERISPELDAVLSAYK